MKKKVCVFLAPGFEEIEAITVVDILRRAGIEVVMVGLSEGPIKGSRGILVLADQTIDQAINLSFDMIVLPGGMEGVQHLGADKRILQIIEKAMEDKKPVAAICAAPLLLAPYLSGKKATSHPSVRTHIKGSYSEERVVVDGTIVTSRSPGTAMEFAFELVRQLAGPERARIVNEGVLAKE
jgi:4-methyl-5(b-hydroxyethyl)-thiazole monophosphate biosynthesis